MLPIAKYLPVSAPVPFAVKPVTVGELGYWMFAVLLWQIITKSVVFDNSLGKTTETVPPDNV